MKQAESLMEDEDMRQRIIANAKAYIESNHSEKAEFEGYSKMATEMCRSPSTKNEEVTDNVENGSEEAADRKVRFAFEKKKSCKFQTVAEEPAESAVKFRVSEKPDATEETPNNEKQSEEQNQVVENETRHQKLEENANNTLQPTSGSKKQLDNIVPPDEGTKNPETSQISSKPDSTPEKEENEEHRAAEKIDSVKQSSAASSSTAASAAPSPRVQIVALKTDIRKRTTDFQSRPNSERNSPPAAAGTGVSTAAKNGPKQPAATNGAKKTGTGALKKVPLGSTTSADKVQQKQSTLHGAAARSFSDASISVRPASRSQKTKK